MIAIPAVDLRDGACVQLVGGEYDQEAVRLDDPLAVAREWARLGFPMLHVVDLDAVGPPFTHASNGSPGFRQPRRGTSPGTA
jgi:phosphoribosylformimino-5-aminoimidazole carboxamide ribotide isomerase